MPSSPPLPLPLPRYRHPTTRSNQSINLHIEDNQMDGGHSGVGGSGWRWVGGSGRWGIARSNILKPHLNISSLLLLLLGGLIYHLLSPTLLSIPILSPSPSTPTPSFLIRPSQIPPPPPPPPYHPSSSSSSLDSHSHPHYPSIEIEEKWRKKGRVVPKVVHYVYGLKGAKESTNEVGVEGGSDVGDGGGVGEEFPYYAYLAIRSVLVNVKPDIIYFHYSLLPTGPWFSLLIPHLTLLKAIVPTQIMGNKLDHFAHKADVIRLEAMQYTGGIYIDIDTYILRSLDDLLYHPMTLGMEASPDSRRGELDPTGLCNAIIISAPHSSFVERWRASYESFREGEWAEHSVEMPWTIARRYPFEIQVLSTRAFFWPMWHGSEVEKVHELDEWDFVGSGQYAYHAWESLAMRYLEKLSPKRIKEGNTSFTKMVRPFVGEQDEEVYARWTGHE